MALPSGLTSTGFSRPLQDEIAQQMLEDQRGTISGDLSGDEDSFIGNFNNICADQLAQAWEVLEEAVNGMDPERATEARLISLSLLTGATQDPAGVGLVTCSLGLGASFSQAAGALVAHVNGAPDNRWVNRDAVTSTTAGTYTGIVFQSETAGSAATAAAGTLTVIASPVSGWTSITNPADAQPGTDIETIESLRLKREASLALPGSGTVDAIRADVSAVEGVISCLVEENTSDSASGGLPAHSFRAVVWDGSPAAADDDDIAQAIQGSRPAGIYDQGTSSGTAIKSDGTSVTVRFERVTVVDVYVSATIVSAVGVLATDVKAALQAAMPLSVGGDVIRSKLLAGASDVDGVDDVSALTLGTAPAPVGTSNISITNTQIARLQVGNIVLSGDVS